MPPTPMPPAPKPAPPISSPMPPVAIPPVAVPPTVVPPPPVGAPTPIDQLEMLNKTSNDACIKRLKQLEVEPASKVYVTPAPPGTNGREINVQTNIFGIEVSKQTDIFQYMVHTKADLATNKEAVFTKKGKDDFVVLDRHSKCCDIFFNAVENNPDFFKTSEGNHLIYDGQSILFSTMNLFEGERPEEPKKKKTRIFQIDGASTKNPDLKSLPCITMEVYQVRVSPMVLSRQTLGSRTADPNLDANNRAYSQLIELALNQVCVKDTERFAVFEHGKVYFVNPIEAGFYRDDCIDVGDGKMLLPGMKKTIQFIEGPYGRGQNNPSVVIDAMKAAFHREECVMEKIYHITQKDSSQFLEPYDRNRVVPIIKGLDCYSTYTGRTRHFQIEGIHHDTAAKARFELKEGGSCTVQQYFADKYNIQLKWPNANLLICKDRGNKNFFPMELMTVSKNQRVTIPQQTSQQSQKTTRECAVLPDVRQRLIVTGKNAIDLTPENPLLQTLGIKVYPEPLLMPCRELDGRELNYAGRVVKTEGGKWRSPQGFYFKPAAVPAVWAVYAVGTPQSRFTPKNLTDFVHQFIDTCERKGMKVGNPAEVKCIDVMDIEQKLEHAIRSQAKFIFMITDDGITHIHSKAKLLERDHEVIIQDMKMTKASSVVMTGKRLTLENVVNKTNIKLGGLNYTVTDLKKSMVEEQLIIGIGTSAPPPGSKFMMEGKGFLNPTIVGFASNAVANHEFTGDFVLSPHGQDTIASIEDVLRVSLDLYQKHRKILPKRIVIYRSGASEGSHGSILSYEIPLARAVIKEYSPNIKIIFMLVTKDHTYRFFKEEIKVGSKCTEMNIQPGLVMDTGVTSPSIKQFFLNSHTTLQGTAKTPLYTVLADDLNAPMDRLEELTYMLCHHHQIVSLTTSVPTPLYVANEYAKRGRALWTEKHDMTPLEVSGSERTRLKELTAGLAYQYTNELANRRVNA